ncbi:non-specific lipid-transfer protein 3-like [Solanum dulcamara]|uniref:non-specific lipid-transfer protein 3-like n=1 Tax=Solanum dulcamara TaxID=45834 RepID=UPI00248535B9|nr:non-specific lipid-transfer protein 3-like [Solanum dulcamara]
MSRNIIPSYSLLSLFLMCVCLVLANAEVECTDVMTKLMPCQGFIMSGDSSPSVDCCSGAQTIDKQFTASDKPDREAICSCLKTAAQFPTINLEKAAMLPALCNLTTKISFDPNVDCSTV